ncbi:MAG: hypothetical protein K8R54_02220 [Bacteroidales bacterium]|nr:hypothetical protein [Bacteroidales bacterium]
MKKIYFLISITLLVGSIIFQSCKREGCTDRRATNYDSKAKTDDGSCIIYGCTDVDATNYNSEATDDDGSCVYPMGEAIFWTDSDYGVGNIAVDVDDSYAGTITTYYSSGVPDCGASGCVTVEKTEGSYSYYATADDGTIWSGNIDITSEGCTSTRFYVVSTKGEAIFWTDADYGVGDISVYVSGSYVGQITGYYSSGTPACGSSGCVTIERDAGTYSFSAQAGSTTWNGYVYISNGGCYTMRLYLSKSGKGMFSEDNSKDDCLRKISKLPVDGQLK